ncbi:transposable element Tcb2 transposase [Trichonephila clavipes]|nr:transposable element Tcb2 transposase [Trichonephila clavipes]
MCWIPYKARTEVDVPSRRFRRQYEQLPQCERGRIISMMEAGWSASDEYRFNLISDDDRVRVWIPLGERLNLAFALQRHTSNKASVKVWGVIAYNTLSPLVLIQGPRGISMTTFNHMFCHSGNGSQEPFFSKTMAWPYMARVSQVCLCTVTTIPWPAQSPDLSPIEHIWDHLGRRVGHLTSLNEPEARLQQIWNEMSHDIMQNLYDSMPDRIASCYHARGRSTGDEAHFWLNDYVNKQNCRIWSETNPQVYVETPLHPEKLTVWCALWAGGILLQKR